MTFPIGKACLPTTIFRGELLNFRGVVSGRVYHIITWISCNISESRDMNNKNTRPMIVQRTITPREKFSLGVHPQKLTWNLEMMVSNRNLLFQGGIFRFHVCFQGCKLTEQVDNHVRDKNPTWMTCEPLLENIALVTICLPSGKLIKLAGKSQLSIGNTSNGTCCIVSLPQCSY